MSQTSNILLLATRVGQEAYALHQKIGVIGNLTTTEKDSLVAAINELDAALKAINIGSIINDAAPSTTTVYSSQKVIDEITTTAQKVKSELLDGADASVDTLKELAVLISENKDLITALNGIAAKSVRVDDPQSFTAEEKAQGRANIGAAAAADLETLTTRVSTAEDKITAVEQKAAGNETAITGLTTRVGANETAIQSNATAIQTLSDNVGDTSTDFVATFEAALAGTASA